MKAIPSPKSSGPNSKRPWAGGESGVLARSLFVGIIKKYRMLCDVKKALKRSISYKFISYAKMPHVFGTGLSKNSIACELAKLTKSMFSQDNK